MIAVDTNLLVRYLVEDDAEQADRAEAVLVGGAVLVPKTVLLETAWVLGSTHRYDRAAIVGGIRRLLGLPGVGVEDALVIRRALAWCEQGLDIADALHLASSAGATRFATFDRALRRKAGRIVDQDITIVAP